MKWTCGLILLVLGGCTENTGGQIYTPGAGASGAVSMSIKDELGRYKLTATLPDGETFEGYARPTDPAGTGFATATNPQGQLTTVTVFKPGSHNHSGVLFGSRGNTMNCNLTIYGIGSSSGVCYVSDGRTINIGS